MPSKGRSRRAASRQAQLSGRRRRRGGRPRAETAVQSQVQQVRRQARPAVTAATVEAPSTVQRRDTTSTVQSQTRRRSTRARAPLEPLQMYPYLGSELRRIGALTGLMAITLTILTFVLR